MRSLRAIVAYVALLLWTTLAFAADWTHVQGVANIVTSTNSIAITAIANGDMVAGCAVIDSGKTVTITDNTGANTYDAFPYDDDGVLTALVFKSRGLITNGPTSINFNFSPAGTPGNFEKAVDEFAPPTGTSAISFDGGTSFMANKGNYNGLAAVDSPVFQNLHNDALIYGCGVAAGATSITVGAAFTTGASVTTGPTVLSEFKIQATPSASNKLNFATQVGSTGAWGGVIAVAPVAATTWVPIQSCHQWPPGSTSTTFSVSCPKATTPGNVLVGLYFPNSGNFSQLSTFTDDKSNTYTFLTPQPSGRSLLWNAGLLANNPQTFSGTLSVADAIGLFVTEFMPPPGTVSVAIDGGGIVTVSSGAPGVATVSTPNITTAKNGDLVYSSVEPAGTAGTVPLNGIGVTNGQGRSLGNGWIVQPTAGAISASWDVNGGSSLTMFEVAISATTGGGGNLNLLGVGH